MNGNLVTIGRDCQVVLIVLGSRVNLPDVTGFEASQQTSKQSGWAVNGDPWEIVMVAGWRGQFDVARTSNALDELFAQIERAQRYSGFVLGDPGSGTNDRTTATIYQYVQNPDGSQNTYEFSGASLEFADAGSYRADGIVRQRVAFFAAHRSSL